LQTVSEGGIMFQISFNTLNYLALCFFSITISACGSQKDISETFLNQLVIDSINIIGKEVPNTFFYETENKFIKRIEKTDETPTEIFIVLTENSGVIESCELTIMVSDFDEARLYYNHVTKYLENENWNFIKYISKYKRPNGALYLKNGMYYGIYEPTPYAIPMCFSRNINLNHFYEDQPEMIYDISYYESKIVKYRNFFDERQEVSSIIEINNIIPGLLSFLVCWNDNLKGYIYELYTFDNNQNILDKYLVGYGPFLHQYRNILMEKLSGNKIENELISFGYFSNDRFPNIVSYSFYPHIGYTFSVYGYSVVEDDFVQICLVPVFINFEEPFPPVEYIGSGFRILEIVDDEYSELAWNEYMWDMNIKK
jgi:hypothetical protein